MHYLRHVWALSSDLKHTVAIDPPTLTDPLCLRVTEKPRPRHLAILVVTTDRQQPIALPLCVHTRMG